MELKAPKIDAQKLVEDSKSYQRLFPVMVKIPPEIAKFQEQLRKQVADLDEEAKALWNELMALDPDDRQTVIAELLKRQKKRKAPKENKKLRKKGKLR